MNTEIYDPFTYIQILFWTFLFATGNVFVKWRLRLKQSSTRSFFVVHALANLIVVYLVFDDTVYTWMNPLKSCVCLKENCRSPALLVATGLHIAHIVTDFKQLGLIDWLHHLLSVFMSSYFLLYYTIGTLKNFALFFINGLPGGIDYALLYLVKSGKIDKILEKRINNFLNMYIRVPFLVAVGTIIWVNWISGHWTKDPTTNGNEMPLSVLCCFIVFISCNSLFFAERVAVSYGRHLANPNKGNIRVNKSELDFVESKSN